MSDTKKSLTACGTASTEQTTAQKRRVLLFYANRERQPWPVMPIGLCHVASALKSWGHEVTIVDLMFERQWSQRVQSEIIRFAPDVIGISVRNIDNVDWFETRTYLTPIRDEVVRPARAVSKAPIIIGGPAVNIAPTRLCAFLDVDYAVYGDGDGEGSIGPLVDALAAGVAPAAIPGVLRGNDDPGQPNRRPNLEGLVAANIHRWIDVKPYARAGSPYSVQTKRGCAFNCSFCVYGAIEGRAYRLRDPEAIADEIETANREAGVRCFEFTDSVFNHPLGHALDVCKAIIRRKLAITLNTTGVNPRYLTPELLQLMAEAGFEELSLAPDSAAPAVLAELGKGYTSPDVLVKAAQMIRDQKLPVAWWFSFGLPGETARSVEQTLAFIRDQVRPSDLVLATVGLRILPGTRLAATALEEGKLSADQDVLVPVFYEPTGISLADIHKQCTAAGRKLPNFLLSTDTRSLDAFLPIGIMLKRIFRHRQPLWRIVPPVNRLRNLLRRLPRFRRAVVMAPASS